MKKRRISKLQLLQELRKLLIRPDTIICRRKLRDCHGHSHWGGTKWEDGTRSIENLRITVDPRRDNMVSVVIHELLHAYMFLFLDISSRFSEELEEKAILAWETALWDYLRLVKNEKLLESWTQAIERKLS